MPAGRPGDTKSLRVQAEKHIEQSTAGLPPEAREAVRATLKTLIPAIVGEIEERVSQGDLEKMSFKELTKELRGMLNAVKGPNVTLNNINVPSDKQPPVDTAKEVIELKRPKKARNFEDIADAEEEA